MNPSLGVDKGLLGFGFADLRPFELLDAGFQFLVAFFRAAAGRNTVGVAARFVRATTATTTCTDDCGG